MNKYIGEEIKVVLFDHDDTLVGTIGPKWDEHKLIAKIYYNKVLSDEEIATHWGKPLHELVCILYGTNDSDEAIAHNQTHHKKFPKTRFPATIPALNKISKAGKKIGIITATNRFSFEHDLTLHNIPKSLLDFTQTSDDTNYHKPDKRVFDPAIEWLANQQIKPNEVIYIGDGLHDMKAALGAGFNFLGVETGLITAEQFKKAGAKSIASIASL